MSDRIIFQTTCGCADKCGNKMKVRTVGRGFNVRVEIEFANGNLHDMEEISIARLLDALEKHPEKFWLMGRFGNEIEFLFESEEDSARLRRAVNEEGYRIKEKE